MCFDIYLPHVLVISNCYWMWLGIKRIMPVEERVIPPSKICIIFHITRSPIQYICYWFSISQWKSSTIWIFGANVKVYTCFFFLFGGFCGYRNITEVVIVIVIVIIIFTLPLPQNTGNNKSQKFKKHLFWLLCRWVAAN